LISSLYHSLKNRDRYRISSETAIEEILVGDARSYLAFWSGGISCQPQALSLSEQPDL